MSTITLYGIANCDTVKRARAWLERHGVSYTFHDYRRAGVPLPDLDRWLDALGWQKLLNRQGTTFRRLGAEQQAAAQDAAGARSLMLAQPSVIKRPVVRWGSGAVSVGFDAEDWQRRVTP